MIDPRPNWDCICMMCERSALPAGSHGPRMTVAEAASQRPRYCLFCKGRMLLIPQPSSLTVIEKQSKGPKAGAYVDHAVERVK